ncbi:MAG: chondroitinase-B domain-containing protein, partial [Polaribacter sp.]
MKQFFKIFILFLVVTSCDEKKSSIIVSSTSELTDALSKAVKGDNIVLKNGTYKDVSIKFVGEGTEDAPITLSAETAGEVFIEGESSLELSGNYLQVRGLFFR